MKTLHILRKMDDSFAKAVIADEAAKHPIALVLIQDGVLTRGDFPEETYVCQEDLVARAATSPYFSINYAGIARLVTECDRVITW